MKLLVGLGNPEEKYANTRHNLGFDVVSDLQRKLNGSEWSNNATFRSELSEIRYPNDHKVLLIRPQTYMNNSGLAVAKLASFYKVEPEDIIIIHDELDLPLGHIKIRLGGSAAGHHGVESIMEKLGTDKFIRVRLGIGNLKTALGERGTNHFGAEHYVLEPFMPNESSDVKKMIKQTIKAIEILLTKGYENAQNQFN
jgi:PTH1 family peptidyl-tRNA hydrolase